MGRKKKFIDKNAESTHTYHLIHRSQRDTRIADDESSRYVLQPSVPPNVARKQLDGGQQAYADSQKVIEAINQPAASKDDISSDEDTPVDPEIRRRQEQIKFGITFDDDHDYLQYLRERGDDVDIIPADPSVMDVKESKPRATINLPMELLPSEEQNEVGMLHLAAPVSGPRLDWDPEVVAALDEDFDLDDPENLLDDDFISQALTDGFVEEDGDATPRAYASDDEDAAEDQWRMIGHAARAHVPRAYDSEDDFEGSEPEHQMDSKSRFTEYSMTSSILPRSEAQLNQDEHFEVTHEQYASDQIGALDEDQDEIQGDRTLADFQSILDEFVHQQETRLRPLTDIVADAAKEDAKAGKSTVQPSHRLTHDLEHDGEEEYAQAGATDEKLLEAIPYKDKRVQQWDCESILSTRSTLYNHPTVISERWKKKKNKPAPVEIHPKSGLPLEAFNRGPNQHQSDDDGEYSDSEDVELEYHTGENLGVRRDKEETVEEKRERKKAIKAERQLRRQAKKATKTAFKQETKRQQSQINGRSTQGVAI